jgi:ELWxxDGT repeat protein
MADKAGNTIRQANTTLFAPLRRGGRGVREIVSRIDRDDYYRFRTSGRTSVEIAIDRMTGNGNLQLLNRAGRVIARSSRIARFKDSINRNLAQGTYYIRVFNARPLETVGYRLVVSGRPDNAGNTFATARNLGTYEDGINSVIDYVGPSDKFDFYKFNLDATKELDISLRNLTGTLRLTLLDENRQRIGVTARRDGRRGASIVETLDPGTYYARVTSVLNSPSSYILFSDLKAVPDGAGGSPASATNLGALPLQGSLTPPVDEFLDANDTDVYSFTANSFADTTLNLTLKGRNGADLSGIDLDLRVLNSSLQQIAINDAAGAGNVTLSDIALTAGETYFVEVSKFNASATSFFQLGFETQVDIDDFAPNTPDTGFNINSDASWNLNNGRRGPFQAGDFVGSEIDEDDYYQFSIDQSSFIDLIVTPDQGDASATANVQFFKREGGGLTPIDTVVQSGNTPERIEGVFESGDYVIRVFPETNSTFAFYDLSLEATSISRIPAFIKDINPGADPSATSQQRMAGLGGSLYFEANDGSGSALWRTDGTLDGTEKLRAFSSIGDMVAINGYVYFVASDAALDVGSELWRTDGSTTEFVRDIFTGATSSNISDFTVVGDYLYFTATDFDDGFDRNDEVWVVNTNFAGSLADSATLLDVNSNPAIGSSPSELTTVGTKLYFLTGDDEIYVSTSGGAPVQVDTSVIDRGVDGDFVALNGQLYFRGEQNSRGREIYRLNATTNAVELLPEIAVEASGDDVSSSGFGNFTAAGNKLYFTASVTGTSPRGQELYVYDSVGNTMSLVKDINVTPNASAPSTPSNLTAVGNELYFSATDSTGQQLWVTDGTAIGTEKVLFEGNPIPITGGSDFIEIGSALYFTANDGVTGQELWRIFPNENPELVDISGDVPSGPSNLTEVNGRLFFRADTETAGRELWVVGLPLDEVI